jgi:phage shock protein PspC (stress-responsive transcriptional regulator)
MCAPGARRTVEDMSHVLARPRRGAVIAGVCAGLARRFDMSPTLVRVLAVASCILPGPQILAYVILWILLPRDPE